MAIRLVTPRPVTSAYEEIQTAESGQVTFYLTHPYKPGACNIQVWINGVRQYSSDYLEAGPNQVVFTEALMEGDEVLFRIG